MHLRFSRPLTVLALACLAISSADAVQIFVGSGPGAASWVKRFSDAPATQLDTWMPFAAEFLGGVTIAAGDGRIVVGAGPGSGPSVKVYNATTLALENSFFAFAPEFTGGVNMAVGEGRIVVGAGPGSAPHVKVFNAVTLTEQQSFFAFPVGFQGGVKVAVGEGHIVAGAGAGAGGGHVKVFNAGTGAEEQSFFPFPPEYTSGVDVAIGGGRLAVGAGPGGGSHVKIYDTTSWALVGSFFAFAPEFTGGVTVAIGEGKLVVGAASGGSQIKVYDLATLALLDSFFPSALSYQAGSRVAITALPPSTTGTTVSPTGRYAYAANFGWIDGRPSSADGVRLTDNVLSGWLYSANTGWISLGDGTPANGVAYANTSATDYGVNVAPSGALTGHAWSPSLGWLTFEAFYGQPAVARSSGAFTGHVWVPNAGWITLSGFPSALVSTTRAEGLDTDVDGLPDFWEIQHFGGIASTTGTDTNATTGTAYRDEYLDATGPFNFGGYTWLGGYIGAPNSISPIQNWSPRVPPETFTGFTVGDVLNVNASGATVNANGAFLTLRALNFNSDGGRLDLLNFEAHTTDGINLLQGTLDISSSVIINGPVTTAAVTTTRVHDGAGAFYGAPVTNAGTWQVDGAYLQATHFVNQGTLVLPNPARAAYVYGHLEGAPGSVLEIDSARAGPGETRYDAGTYNSFAGSLDWTGGGDFDIGLRSWTFVALLDRTPTDVSSLSQTNRFRLGGVDVTLDTDAYFSVRAAWLTPYDKVAPQVELSDLTLANAGTFRFQVDEIALRNLSVTGNPIEITGENARLTRIREVTQAASSPGTLRAHVFGGNFALEQPTLNNAIELTLGRATTATSVAVPDFVNAATLRFVGSSGGGDTRITPPVADTPTSPIRTLTNNGTLAFGPGYSTIVQRVVNTGNLTVATGADVALNRFIDNQGSITIAPGGRLVSGAEGTVSEGEWINSHINNQGEFILRDTALTIAGVGNDNLENTFTGNPVTIENTRLRLAYLANQAVVTNFAFSGDLTRGKRVTTDAPVVALYEGSFWRVNPDSNLSFSALVNAGTFELAGSYNGVYPTAFLQPEGELTNTGLFRTANFGGVLSGLLINYGQVEVAAGTRLHVSTPPHEEGVVTLPGRLINQSGGTVHVAQDGMIRLTSGLAPVSVFEQLGGLLDNDGTFQVDQLARFLFTGGNITGNAIRGYNAALEIGGAAGTGSFVVNGPVNTLALPNALLPAGVTLRVESTSDDGSGATLTAAAPFTNRGTLELASSAPPAALGFVPYLNIPDQGLLNDTTGTLHLAHTPGLHAKRQLDLNYRGAGRVVIDPGVRGYAYLPGGFPNWLVQGPMEVGAGAFLRFPPDSTFMVSATGSIRGSGEVTTAETGFSGPKLNVQVYGTLEPVGTLTFDDLTFTRALGSGGRLIAHLRSTGVDRIVANGTLMVTNPRVDFVVDQGVTIAPGVRYTLMSADVFQTNEFDHSGFTLTLDTETAKTFVGRLDSNGTTLGVTLTARRTFATWAASFNLSGAPVNSDADGDGLPLLLEYAFGLDPTRTDRSPLALTSQTSPVGALVLTFPWHRDSLDYTWRAETSTTLATGSWTTAASVTTVITPNSDPALATVTLTIPVTGPRNFARLVVTPGTPPLN